MRWTLDGARWPHVRSSRFYDVRPHVWHVQEMGPFEGPSRAAEAPAVVLLHGAGASTHSWRALAPRLAARLRVIAIDLPGQGFSRIGRGARARCGLEATAEDMTRLFAAIDVAPAALIGHSAGAVLAARLALDAAPRALVSINGAFGQFPGAAALAFPVMARLLAMNPFAAPAFARLGAAPGAARALLSATGDDLDAEGAGYYQRLISNADHVDATLAMMSQWAFQHVLEALPGLETPTLFLVGARDRAVPPETASPIAATMPRATVEVHDAAAHLPQETHPDWTSARVLTFLEAHGVGGSAPSA